MCTGGARTPAYEGFRCQSAQRSTLTGEPLFRLAEAGAARCLPPMSCMQRVAKCKQGDAAPVLFDRAASAADQVRRLVRLNAMLCGGVERVLSSQSEQAFV